MVESRRVHIGRRSVDGRLQRRRLAWTLPVRKPRPQRAARPELRLERLVPNEMVPVD